MTLASSIPEVSDTQQVAPLVLQALQSLLDVGGSDLTAVLHQLLAAANYLLHLPPL